MNTTPDEEGNEAEHFANSFTHQVANEAINNESPLSQPSSGCPSTSLPEEIKKELPRRRIHIQSNAQPKELAKWVCPVCGKGWARSITMREHTKSHCLNPKTYR
jgi:hypothetical protein